MSLIEEEALSAALFAALGDRAGSDEAEAVVPYLASMLSEEPEAIASAPAFAAVASELLLGYGLCDDDALAALCETLRAACRPLLPEEPSGGGGGGGGMAAAGREEALRGGGPRLLEAPIVIERDDERAKAEALACLDAPQARGMVTSMGEALYANNSDGLHEAAQVKVSKENDGGCSSFSLFSFLFSLFSLFSFLFFFLSSLPLPLSLSSAPSARSVSCTVPPRPICSLCPANCHRLPITRRAHLSSSCSFPRRLARSPDDKRAAAEGDPPAQAARCPAHMAAGLGEEGGRPGAGGAWTQRRRDGDEGAHTTQIYGDRCSQHDAAPTRLPPPLLSLVPARRHLHLPAEDERKE